MAIFVGQREEWRKPLDKMLRLANFLMRLDETKVGESVEISEELWRALKSTLESDDFELAFPHNMQLPVLLQAVFDAKAPSQSLKEVSQA